MAGAKSTEEDIVKFATCAVTCLLAGCANLVERDCRSDWYQVGLRDGHRGDQPDVDAYAAACARFGVRPDAARYRQGWEDGFGELNLRRRRGGD